MSPNLWLPDVIPKRQTRTQGDQVLSLDEQINAWYGINQKLVCGIQDVEFEMLRASSSQKLTDDDRIFGYSGVALFYGFGDDGRGNADATLISIYYPFSLCGSDGSTKNSFHDARRL